MTVFFNARFLTQPQSGVQRYAFNILTELDKRWRVTAGPPAVAFYPANSLLQVSPRWSHIKLRPLSYGAGHFWEQHALLKATSHGLLISLCNAGPLLHRNQILALHDAHIYDHPAAFSRKYRTWHLTLRQRLAKRATRLIGVSPHATGRLAHHLKVPQHRFSIVPNAADHLESVSSDRSILKRLDLRDCFFFLAVGNLGPIKNLPRLIAAHAQLGSGAPKLVIVGSKLDLLAQERRDLGCGVVLANGLNDAELKALLESATAFVAPSIDEGFGIPALEAASLGTLVVAAKTGAMPWVLGDAPIWCDPQNTQNIKSAMARALSMSVEDERRHVASGRARADQFAWSASAAKLDGIITEQLTPRQVAA